jgi:hypothetical protein
MPFIGDTGQLSNIYEKNYETTTLRIVEGDTAFQAYNPADSHYKLITNLQEISEIGAVTDRTIQFTNVTTSFTTTSNVGISNTNPVHTLDIGSNVQIDDVGSNTFWTSGTVYATNYAGETATVTNSVTTRDVLIDRVFPKTNGFVQMTSDVGIGLTGPTEKLHVSGNILATGDVTAHSDERVKIDIRKIEDPLNKVCSINGYTYKRTDTGDDKTHTGVLAQEVMEVLPEVVHGSEDTTYSVAYGNMVGLLIEAIKELKLEIDELKKSR